MYRYRTSRAEATRNAPPVRNAYGETFRDAPTLLCYGALAAYAYWLYAYGPALALLRSELHFSYAVLGVYSAIWSVGAALAGVSFAPVARRLPRAPLLWSSAAAATAGIALFTASRTVALTLIGGALAGFAGTVLLTCIQAILSDRHGDRRGQALVEANVGAAGCAVLAPLMLGLFQATPLGWRAALALPVLALAGLYLRYRHQPLPPPPPGRPTGRQARLSLSCWLLAAMVAVGIAIEFCPIYFGTEVLTSTGLRTAQAATAMSAFYLGILLSRIGGAVLIRRAGRTVLLLCVSLAVTTAGFGMFWLATQPALAIAGLAVCGIGLANLYPLSLALTLAAAPGNADTANARTQLIGGLFVVAAPFLLGILADHFGLHAAFTVEPVLIGAAAVLLLAGLRLAPPARLSWPGAGSRGMLARGSGPLPPAGAVPGPGAAQRRADAGRRPARSGGHGPSGGPSVPGRRRAVRSAGPAHPGAASRPAAGRGIGARHPGTVRQAGGDGHAPGDRTGDARLAAPGGFARSLRVRLGRGGSAAGHSRRAGRRRPGRGPVGGSRRRRTRPGGLPCRAHR